MTARVQSVDGQSYAATSITSNATVNQLRSVNVRRIPLTVAARYTALPNDIPERVTDLAFDIVADLTNPYDQAVAIEQFLRQYLTISMCRRPISVDIVDYFLFDAQAGYCDYYASAWLSSHAASGCRRDWASAFSHNRRMRTVSKRFAKSTDIPGGSVFCRLWLDRV